MTGHFHEHGSNRLVLFGILINWAVQGHKGANYVHAMGEESHGVCEWP